VIAGITGGRGGDGAGLSSSARGWVDLVFHPVGLAFDDDGLRAVQEAVEDGGGGPGYAAPGITGTMPQAGLCRIPRPLPSERALLDAA